MDVERIDVDFDIPDSYLPELPPPLFLTTHKELGDVTEGREVTLGNYYEIFDGLLTAEQMEGLKELLRPGIIKALGNSFAPAQFRDAHFSPQSLQNDPDLLLAGVLLPRPTLDLPDYPFRSWLLHHDSSSATTDG